MKKGLSTSKKASVGSSRKLEFFVGELVTDVDSLFTNFSADICMVVVVIIEIIRGLSMRKNNERSPA